MITEQQKESKIITAIAKIMGEVGSVEKRGTNKFHDYKYASAADVAHALQKLLSTNGVVIIQTEKSMRMEADNTVMFVTYEFTLAHVSGEMWNEKIVQTGMATLKNTKGGIDDKAANKCHTAARKYFLLALFQIPTGDYDDVDADEDRAPSHAAASRNHDPLEEELKAKTTDLVKRIELCETLDELNTMVQKNTILINQLVTTMPEWHKRLLERIHEQRHALAPKAEVVS